MKFILFTLVVVSLPAFAQPRGGMMGMRTPAFQALDADGDGVISAAELANAGKALKSLDGNGDGKLTEDEARPAGPSADDMVQTLMAFDKNGDGKLAKDELPERMGLGDRRLRRLHDVRLADRDRAAPVPSEAAFLGSAGRGRGLRALLRGVSGLGPVTHAVGY